MARVYRRTGATITVVSNDALTADDGSASAATPTDIETVSSGNADGAMEIEFLVNIDSAGGSLSGINLYISVSDDDTTYTEKEYALTVAAESAGRYSLGFIHNPAKYIRAYCEAIDDTATVDLYAIPYHYADE